MQMIENILTIVIYTDYFMTNCLFELIMLITEKLQIFSWVWKCCKCIVWPRAFVYWLTSMQMNFKKYLYRATCKPGVNQENASLNPEN